MGEYPNDCIECYRRREAAGGAVLSYPWCTCYVRCFLCKGWRPKQRYVRWYPRQDPTSCQCPRWREFEFSEQHCG